MSKRFKRLFLSTFLIALSLCFVFAFGCSGKGDDNGGTNTQELAIDEGDIVKSVGNRIYKVQSDGVTVYEVSDGSATLVASLSDTRRIVPVETYVTDDKLVVIAGKSNEMLSETAGYSEYVKTSYSTLAVYSFDIKDIPVPDSSKPALDLSERIEYRFEMPARYLTSRLNTTTGEMIFALNYPELSIKYTETEGSIGKVPTIAGINYSEGNKDGLTQKTLENLSRIKFASENYAGSTATLFMKFNLADVGAGCVMSGVYGAAYDTLYVSENGIYPVFWGEKNGAASGCFFSFGELETYVLKLNSATLETVNAVNLSGYTVYDRQALKQFGDKLYVVCSRTNGAGTSVVAFNASDLSLCSELKNIAPDEDVKSVSYKKEADGKLSCLITTYRNIDPLFKVDITDPENMSLTGELSAIGYPTYILNLCKENETDLGHSCELDGLSVGIGYGGTEQSANRRILKVTLYDTTKSSVTALDYLTLSGLSYAEAIRDSRAVCVFEGGYFGFAVSYYGSTYSAEIGSQVYDYDDIRQAFLVFGVKDGKLENIAMLSNFGEEGTSSYLKTEGYTGYGIFRLSATRARYISGYLYVLSDGAMSSYKVNTEGAVSLEHVALTDTALKKLAPYKEASPEGGVREISSKE